MALRKGKDHLRLSVKACPYFGHVRNQRARAISERDSDAKLKITRGRPKGETVKFLSIFGVPWKRQSR